MWYYHTTFVLDCQLVFSDLRKIIPRAKKYRAFDHDSFKHTAFSTQFHFSSISIFRRTCLTFWDTIILQDFFNCLPRLLKTDLSYSPNTPLDFDERIGKWDEKRYRKGGRKPYFIKLCGTPRWIKLYAAADADVYYNYEA
ncbi:MAG: hypothetical protein ACLR23_13760 [Clostridia bacterium]